MTRIESNLPSAGPDGDIGEMIKTEAKKLRPEKKVVKKRPLFGCFNCFLVLIIVVVAVGGWLASLAAKSGLAQLPVFNGVFYQLPEPIHWVKAGNAAGALDLQKLAADPTKPLVISEEELTAWFREGVVNANFEKYHIKIESGQLAVDPLQVELFAKISQPFAGYLTLAFAPQLRNQKLYLAAKNLKIGNLSLPTGWGQFLLDRTYNGTLASVQGSLPFAIKNISLRQGSALIEINQGSLNKIIPGNVKQ